MTEGFFGAEFLQAGCPSCHPTNSVKPLKAVTDAKATTLKHRLVQLCPFVECKLLKNAHFQLRQMCIASTNLQNYIGTVIINGKGKTENQNV